MDVPHVVLRLSSYLYSSLNRLGDAEAPEVPQTLSP